MILFCGSLCEFRIIFPFYALYLVMISFTIMLLCQALEPPSEEAIRSAISLLYEVLRFSFYWTDSVVKLS